MTRDATLSGRPDEQPDDAFRTLWAEAKKHGSLTHRNAVCASTIDADGYPNSRFVDLKEADEAGFVFCTDPGSAKPRDIAGNPRAGIALRWEHVSTQVRIKGSCTALSAQEADAHWASGSQGAQLVSTTFRQSQALADVEPLARAYPPGARGTRDARIRRPQSRGGVRLRPVHIEFPALKEDRRHIRTAYTRVGARWHKGFVRP